LRYRWAASAGRVGGAGNEAAWDLSGVGAGVYTASVKLETSAGDVLARKETNVAVRECHEPRRVVSCPSIALCCRASVTEGSPAPFNATLEGGTPNVTPTISWRLSAGRALTGLAAPRIELDTAGLGGQTVLATVEAEGYGLKCSSTCATIVTPAAVGMDFNTGPNDGHTVREHKATVATPTPTPSPSPTPSPTPTPQAVATYFRPLLVLRVLGSLWAYMPWLLLLAAMGTALTIGVRAKGGSPPTNAGDEPAAPTPPDGSPSPDAPTPPDAPFTPPAGLPDEAAACEAPAGDEVHCTVFAPPSAAPGDGFLVQAFAHLREHASQLLEIAGDSIIDPKQMGSKKLTVTVERGGELTFFLAMPGLEIDEPTQAITWDGEINSVEFGVTVPETFKPKTLFGTITLSYESVPIGHVKFMFKIVAEPACEKAEAMPAEPPSQSFLRYRQAFISYASEDRAEVLKRVQMLKTVRINFFQDILSLDPGEQWEQLLYKYIDESDVIFLFWSSAAKRSQWVERELRHALDRRGGSDVAPPEIVPVILEGPPFVAPPEYLQQLHFGDRFAYFIKAEEEARQPTQQA
nr:toll/interleukin-1 receptor domain-containing protein [Acidobacteriota bacterium]